MWLCHPYLSWSRDEEEQPGNTGRQKTSEGQGLESTGPCLRTLQRGPIKARSIPGGREDSQPSSRTSLQPSSSFIISLQPFCLPQRCGTILKCLVASSPTSTSPPPCNFYISSFKEQEPAVKGQIEEIHKRNSNGENHEKCA